MGAKRAAPAFQAKAPGVKTSGTVRASRPMNPVSESAGSRFAPRDADALAGRDDALLGGEHVGAPREQLGRDAVGQVGHHRHVDQRDAACDRAGRTPEEHRELVLLHRR